jgi:hypothetical protein
VKKHSEAQQIADGRGGHVEIQRKVALKDFGANRAYHHNYFEHEARAPNKEFDWTRHVIPYLIDALAIRSAYVAEIRVLTKAMEAQALRRFSMEKAAQVLHHSSKD